MSNEKLSVVEKEVLFNRVRSVIAALCDNVFDIDALSVPWEKPIVEFLTDEDVTILRANVYNVLGLEINFEIDDAYLNIYGKPFSTLEEFYQEIAITSLITIERGN